MRFYCSKADLLYPCMLCWYGLCSRRYISGWYLGMQPGFSTKNSKVKQPWKICSLADIMLFTTFCSTTSLLSESQRSEAFPHTATYRVTVLQFQILNLGSAAGHTSPTCIHIKPIRCIYMNDRYIQVPNEMTKRYIHGYERFFKR